MLCYRCYKDKPEHLIGKTTEICRTCLYGEREKRYRKKHKAQMSAYFKKWYEAHRGERKRKKDYSARNQRIHKLYMNTAKRYSMASLAKIFHMSPPRVFKIIKQEEKRLKESE